MCPQSPVPYAKRMSWMQKSATSELLQFAHAPDVISFYDGSPDASLFPGKELAEAAQHVLINMTSDALQYGSTTGLAQLRASIVELMAEDGVTVAADNIAITAGSQQSIDLMGRLLLDPGDLIMVENPAFMAALSTFRSYGVRFAPVTVDRHGACVNLIADMIDQERPKCMYLLPNFQNPMGVSMSLARRQQVVQIAADKGVLIIEDDPYCRLRFAAERLPTLFELDAARAANQNQNGSRPGNVVYMGSFSKILAPGLRVAWTLSTPELAHQISRAKNNADFHTSALAQAVVYEYVRRGLLPDNIERVRNAYRARRDAMYTAIDRYLPSGVQYTRPEGGLFLWLSLPEHMNAIELLKRCPEYRVAFVQARYSPSMRSFSNALRLTYAPMSTSEIDEGIQRLGRAIKSMM